MFGSKNQIKLKPHARPLQPDDIPFLRIRFFYYININGILTREFLNHTNFKSTLEQTWRSCSVFQFGRISSFTSLVDWFVRRVFWLMRIDLGVRNCLVVLTLLNINVVWKEWPTANGIIISLPRPVSSLHNWTLWSIVYVRKKGKGFQFHGSWGNTTTQMTQNDISLKCFSYI